MKAKDLISKIAWHDFDKGKEFSEIVSYLQSSYVRSVREWAHITAKVFISKNTIFSVMRKHLGVLDSKFYDNVAILQDRIIYDAEISLVQRVGDYGLVITIQKDIFPGIDKCILVTFSHYKAGDVRVYEIE